MVCYQIRVMPYRKSIINNKFVSAEPVQQKKGTVWTGLHIQQRAQVIVRALFCGFCSAVVFLSKLMSSNSTV